MSDFFLADDLSGALDAGAAFHAAGRPVLIALSPDAEVALAPQTLVGFTTETRNAAPAAAAEVVRRTIMQGRARGWRLVYKKIDSTLRGPVAAELAALRDALPAARILFTPANPRAGRTVRGGVLRVHGVPVAETEFGRDPANPVRESAIPVLLGEIARTGVTIADAETEGDLAAAVAAMDAGGESWVGVGSGGLAQAVAQHLARTPPPHSHAHRTDENDPGIPPGPALFVCGSAHPRNREQAARLASARDVEMHEVIVGAPAAAINGAVSALRRQKTAVLLLEDRRTSSASALQAIVRAAQAVVEATEVRRLFVTGGETAFAVCRELGLPTLELRAEIEPGVVLARGTAQHGAVLAVVKNGGFGEPDAWIKAAKRLGVAA